MIVAVTTRHLVYGVPSSSEECPIALALRDLGCVHVSVDLWWIRFYLNGRPYNYDTPSQVSVFMMEFDANHPVRPFEFEL